jgi:hypothetical protein
MKVLGSPLARTLPPGLKNTQQLTRVVSAIPAVDRLLELLSSSVSGGYRSETYATRCTSHNPTDNLASLIPLEFYNCCTNSLPIISPTN